MTITVNDKLAYLLAGTTVGAIVGMLFAPQSAQALRQAVASKTHEAASTISNTLKEGRRLVEESSPAVSESVGRVVERARNVASIGRQRVNESIEAGKSEYERQKSDLSGV